MSPYSPPRYWAELHERGDLSAVGQSGLPSAMNDWLYRILRRNLKAFLLRQGMNRIDGDVFEVGAGTGYWFGLWRELGARRIDACDLVPAAVETLRARYGSLGSYDVVDISAADMASSRTYSLVACMNVLLHVTDEARFDVALDNVARLVSPGGHLLLTEPMLFTPGFDTGFDADRHSRARPVARYRERLEAGGLQMIVVEGATAVGNNPIEGRRRFAYALWRAGWSAFCLPSRLHASNAAWVGRLLYTLDPIALAAGAAPSSKFALLQRPGR